MFLILFTLNKVHGIPLPQVSTADLTLIVSSILFFGFCFFSAFSQRTTLLQYVMSDVFPSLGQEFESYNLFINLYGQERRVYWKALDPTDFLKALYENRTSAPYTQVCICMCVYIYIFRCLQKAFFIASKNTELQKLASSLSIWKPFWTLFLANINRSYLFICLLTGGCSESNVIPMVFFTILHAIAMVFFLLFYAIPMVFITISNVIIMVFITILYDIHIVFFTILDDIPLVFFIIFIWHSHGIFKYLKYHSRGILYYFICHSPRMLYYFRYHFNGILYYFICQSHGILHYSIYHSRSILYYFCIPLLIPRKL